jgi:hypothetical protein
VNSLVSAKRPGELAVSDIDCQNSGCPATKKYLCESASGGSRVKTLAISDRDLCKVIEGSGELDRTSRHVPMSDIFYLDDDRVGVVDLGCRFSGNVAANDY